MKTYILMFAIVVSASSSGVNAAPLFVEDFGALAHGTGITTDNTALSYARVGTGAGAYLNARNPGSFSGSSAVLLATSTSLTGIGVTNESFSPFETGTLELSFHTPAAFDQANDLYLFVGTGSTFMNNSLCSGNDMTAGFSISSGQLQTRSSANIWEAIGTPLLEDTSYNLRIVFNGSSSAVSYGAQSVAPGTADVWLNSALFADDVSIRDAVDVSAFRIYTTGSAADAPYEVDNIRLFDTASPVPEPSLAILAIICALLGTGCLPRKR